MSVERVAATLRKEHFVFHCYFDSAKFQEQPRSIRNNMRQALLMAYNPSAVKRFKSQIAACRPDVILLHNVFPVGSVGVYLAAIQSGIPILHYIHNFRPFSVNGYLWGQDRMILEGLRKNFWPEILAGSWQGSRLKTAWYGAIITVMHWMGIYRRIDGWLAISKFMQETFVSAGIPQEKVFLLRHSWDMGEGDELAWRAPSQPSQVSETEPTILFLGRLTEAKGLRVLIEAWKQLKDEGIRGKLIIGGEGPLAEWIMEQQANVGQLEYLGSISGPQKKTLLMECRAVVVPSIWWEPLGLVVYEAYQYNRPVIGAQSGGLSETIVNGETGWLYPPEDVRALKACMIAALENQSEADRRGEAGRAWVIENTGGSAWMDDFNTILDAVTAKRKSKRSRETSAPSHPSSNASAASPAPPQSNPIPHGHPSVHPSPSAAEESSNIQNPKSKIPPSSLGDLSVLAVQPSSSSPSQSPLSAFQVSALPFRLTAYLADQNPGHDRSYGISRMSQVVLDALAATGEVEIEAITSKTSQQAPVGVARTAMLPWGTRRKWVRLFTDHFHPMFRGGAGGRDVYYYPKGYLPLVRMFCHPAVVTIHDTIIQYDEDHYPEWRDAWEYRYWSWMLRHTLQRAGEIMTVSESSRRQIEDFMVRHGIPAKPITVTYEPCLYEAIAQPVEPRKEGYVIHLASHEPHKRTAHLIRWWHEAEAQGMVLPMLHFIGRVPPEVAPLLASSHSIVRSPFLDEAALQAAYGSARALILPSEIEGFGLPALEAYYLGTPVCYVKGTSVEEILGVATAKGGFSLESADSLWRALDEVLAMPAEDVRECGLKLRETYAAEKVVARMLEVFREVAAG